MKAETFKKLEAKRMMEEGIAATLVPADTSASFSGGNSDILVIELLY